MTRLEHTLNVLVKTEALTLPEAIAILGACLCLWDERNDPRGEQFTQRFGTLGLEGLEKLMGEEE